MFYWYGLIVDRKDKTLQEILSTLEVLHQKVDQLRADKAVDKQVQGQIDALIAGRQRSTYSQSLSTRSFPSFDLPNPSGSEVQRILTWPAVERLLRSDLDEIHHWEHNYSSTEEWLARITEDFDRPLIVDGRVDIVTENSAPYFQESSSQTLPLSNDDIEELTSAFFSSFHCIYPILDREHFYNTILPQAKLRRFEETDESSPLVLLVLALGSVAQQGTVGEPIFEESSGRRTGVKGGDVQSPPGLKLLHEALRRMGMLLSRCSLALLQCHLLTA